MNRLNIFIEVHSIDTMFIKTISTMWILPLLQSGLLQTATLLQTGLTPSTRFVIT